MFPWENYAVVRAIHEERIREALAKQPSWVNYAARSARVSLGARVSDRVRVSVAQALRQAAALVEPGSLAAGPGR